MPRKTKQEDTQIEEVFTNPEFSKYADQFIGVIKRHYRMIDGINVEREQTLAVATKILEERLK